MTRLAIQVIGAAAVALMTHAVIASASKVKLVNNGYEGVVVAIGSSVDESQANNIINSIKTTFSEASEVLFKATRKRAFFRDVKILLPTTWTKTASDDVAVNENFDDSDIRVDLSNGVYGNQPYTKQVGECGDPGLYMHLTPEYLTDDIEANQWGPRAKTIVHEWAKLRWGVFDEIGFPNDQKYPLFYIVTNQVEGTTEYIVKPNHCANEKIAGEIRELSTGKECRWSEGELPDENCRFFPEEDQTAVSSLMSLYNIVNVEEFCDSDTKRHVTRAPNKHNDKCLSRSVWEVIMDHSDFAENNNPAIASSSPPTFTVLRQEEAKFALVLDYSYSMRDFDRIIKLQKVARRWILHEVAEGSSVAVVSFGGSARLEAPLTLIQGDASRQDLADKIHTNLRSATSIGAGLRKAVNEVLNGVKNGVIILITDGEENTSPYIADVKDSVVAAGVRVVTIAFGASADPKLESLAQVTDGKTFSVLDTDTGNQLLDGFLSALTYQPGDTIVDTNIKIHEFGYSGPDKTASSAFFVDDSIGRDLIFHLETSDARHTPSPPFLVRPNGSHVETATFDSLTKSWTITIPLAETGEWVWSVELSGSEKDYIDVDVTSKAKSPDQLPIYTTAWVSAGTGDVDATTEPVIVYAKVEQGNNPVVGATVKASISLSNETVKDIELDLFDNGAPPDALAGDGVYSRYLADYPSTGRYIVKAQVWNNGSAFINNGFIANRRPTRSLRRFPRAVPSNPSQTPVYCCGSEIPFDAETATPTGEFSRYVSAGSFVVKKVPVAGDAFAPSRVTDLHVTATSPLSLSLTWTATGDDLDAGTVSGYEIRLSSTYDDLLEEAFDLGGSRDILALNSSMEMPHLLIESGRTVNLTLELEEAIENGRMYHVALRAVDDVGRKSKASNVADVFLAAPESGFPVWLIVCIAIACVALVAAVIVIAIVCRRRKGERVPQENPDF